MAIPPLLTVRQVPSKDRGTRIITAEGEIDLSTVWQLRHGIREAVEEGVSRLIVDLSAVEFIDGAGLRCLIDGDRAMRLRRRELVIVADNPHVTRVLTLTDAGRRLLVVSSLSAAFA